MTTYVRRDLEALNLAVSYAVSQCDMPVEYSSYLCDVSRSMIAQLRSYVWSERMGSTCVQFTFTHAEPETWWDAFKVAHPWVDRWFYDFVEPPRYRHYRWTKSVPVEATALFPAYREPRGVGPVRYRLTIAEHR